LKTFNALEEFHTLCSKKAELKKEEEEEKYSLCIIYADIISTT
jgi:hypothetical protein